MGRELKQVPLDFAWPLDKVWGGYLNPYWRQQTKCPSCDGSGYSPQAKLFSDQWYGNAPFNPAEYGAVPLTVDHPGVQAFARRNVEHNPDYYGTGDKAVQREARRLFSHWKNQWSHHLIQADVDALLAADRLYDFTRVPLNDEQREIVRKKVEGGGNSWLPESNGYVPNAREVNDWSLSGMGHDGINQWICLKARCEREEVPVECGKCDDGHLWPSAEIKKLYDDWTESEPPTGDGFQLWTTTNEGAPITPVFATLAELCDYAAVNCTTFGYDKATAEEWRQMLDENFVRSQHGNMIFI